MTGKEKIYFLIDTIKDVRDITPTMLPLKIDPANDLSNKYTVIELEQLFVKLERDEKILTILKVPNRLKMVQIVEDLDPYESYESDDGCYHIKLLPTFDEYYQKLQSDVQKKIIKKQESEQALRPGIFYGYTELTPNTAPAREIADAFSEQNRHYVKTVLEDMLSLAEFSSDGKIAYQLKSPDGEDLIRERSLLKKFEAQGLFRNLGEDGIFGIVSLNSLNINLIKEVVKRFNELDSGVISDDEFQDIKDRYAGKKNHRDNFTKINKKDEPLWLNDFKWEGKKFIFGEYGSTQTFKSDDRKALFAELTKAKGKWVTVRKLREVTEQGDDYIRPTIGQIEKCFSGELSRHISIPSTKEDDLLPKPEGGEGAYRIKITQDPI